MPKYFFLHALIVASIVVSCEPAPTPIATRVLPTAALRAVPTTTATETPTPAKMVIQLQFDHALPQQNALDALIEKFNASHEEKVTAKFQGTYVDLQKKMESGKMPDLILAYPPEIAGYAKSGSILALDDLMKDSKAGFSLDDLKDIFPAFIDRYPQLGNNVYSIGFARSLQVMFYNADLLKLVGVSKPPESWDDLMKTCAALSKTPEVICYEMDPNALDFETWVRSRGGSLLGADGKKVSFDQKPGLDTLTFVNDLFTKKYAIVTTKPFQDQSDFAAGKVAFTFDTTLALPHYDRAIKSNGKTMNWGIALSPRLPAFPNVVSYGPSIAIFKSSRERQQAAFLFAKWIIEKEVNAEFARATFYFPARQSSKAALGDFMKSNPQFNQAFDLMRLARGEPNVSAWNPIRGILADTLIQAAGGKAAPADALKDAAKKANEALASQ